MNALLAELEQALKDAEAQHGASSLQVAAVLEEYAAALNNIKGRYLDSLNAAARARHVRAQCTDSSHSGLSLSEEIGRSLEARMVKESKDKGSNRKVLFISMAVVSLLMGYLAAVLMPTPVTPVTPVTYCGSVLSSFSFCWFLFLSRSRGKGWFTLVCALPLLAIPSFWLVYRRESHIPGVIFLLGLALAWAPSIGQETEIPGLNHLLKYTSAKGDAH